MNATYTVIPKHLRAEMAQDPEYGRCALEGLLEDVIGPCEGRITREHALYYAGRKVQARFAIIPCCARHHGVDRFQDAAGAPKRVREWAALNRATDEELQELSKATDAMHRKEYLNAVYGEYQAPPIPLWK